MKKITVLSLSVATYLSSALPAFALEFGSVNPCPQSGTNVGLQNLCAIGADGIGGIVQAILTILFIVAILLALGFLIFGGIKWVLSGGDKAKVEAARGTIVAALVGLVLVFLAYFVIGIIGGFFGLKLFIFGDSVINIPSLVP